MLRPTLADRASRIGTGLLLILLLAYEAPGQDLLQRVRQTTDSPAESSSDDRVRNKDHGPDDCDDGWGSLFGPVILYGVAAPVWVPALLLKDDGGPAWFLGHPYVFSDMAYLAVQSTMPDGGNRTLFDPERFKPWTARLAIEDGLVNSCVNRVGSRFAFDTAWRIGVTANADFFTERTSNGQSDQLMLGDLDLTWRFAQADWIQMRVGLGARGLFDRDHNHGGVNVLYGAEILPYDPFVVSVQAEVGNLNTATVYRMRASLGVQWEHAELFAGYDWLRLGSVELYGPMLGVRFWF